MGMWKEKVLPKIQKFFGKDGTKKAAAAEACKSFDESKEAINKELEEKQEELKPKVIEIYEASSIEIKNLIKEPKEPGLKKHSPKVQKFLDELVKIEFPGSKTVCEATSKYGPALVPGPVIFVFEKVSTFVATEEVATKEVEVPPPPTSAEPTAEEPPAPAAAAAATETETEEIVVEEAAVAESEKADAPAETKEEPPKVEEKPEEPPKA